MNQRRQIMVDSKLQFHFFWLWIAVSAGILAVVAIVKRFFKGPAEQKEVSDVVREIPEEKKDSAKT